MLEFFVTEHMSFEVSDLTISHLYRCQYCYCKIMACERNSFLALTKDHIYSKDDVISHMFIFCCSMSDWECYKNGFGNINSS